MLHVRVRAALTASSLRLRGGAVPRGLQPRRGRGDGSTATEPSTSSSGAEQGGGTVVLATHESFHLPKKLVQAFEAETGYDLEVRAAGDAGTLATKLSLTADNPIADAAFGIDNTFASRPLGEGAFAEVTTTATPPRGVRPARGRRPAGADRLGQRVRQRRHRVVRAGGPRAAAHPRGPRRRPLPRPLRDAGRLDQQPRDGLLPGDRRGFGDSWPDYWTELLDNGAKVVDGWEDAYYGDFTAGSDDGTRPIVVSYDSSPAFTVSGGRTTTAALLDTCFRQVEYAGVLAGADNPAGAEALVDWMLTDEVQSALPESMYVFPVMPGATVPEDWAEFAPQPSDPYEVTPPRSTPTASSG
jgi:thiamine transport system substrate-binding protein